MVQKVYNNNHKKDNRKKSFCDYIKKKCKWKSIERKISHTQTNEKLSPPPHIIHHSTSTHQTHQQNIGEWIKMKKKKLKLRFKFISFLLTSSISFSFLFLLWSDFFLVSFLLSDKRPFTKVEKKRTSMMCDDWYNLFENYCTWFGSDVECNWILKDVERARAQNRAI